jgi:hypothetical protein
MSELAHSSTAQPCLTGNQPLADRRPFGLARGVFVFPDSFTEADVEVEQLFYGASPLQAESRDVDGQLRENTPVETAHASEHHSVFADEDRPRS